MPSVFLEKIAKKAVQEGGISADLQELTIVNNLDEWLFPRWPDLTVIVPAKRLAAALAEFTATHKDKLTDDIYLGVWRHAGKYYIDINAHTTTFKDAENLAKSYSTESERTILSAYNPAQGKTRFFTM